MVNGNRGFGGSNKKLKTEISCLISFDIVKQGRPFTDGVFVKQMCSKILQKLEHNIKLFENILLSPRTVARRTDQLGMCIESAILKKIIDCKLFSICLDETTDVNDLCQVAICVGTVDINCEATETLFSLEAFYGNVTRKLLFDVVNE